MSSEGESTCITGLRQAGRVLTYGGRGVNLRVPMGPIAVKAPSGGGRRGRIIEWTAASRRRLRESLLSLAAAEGWVTCGLTFTVPGEPLPVVEARGLWVSFCRSVTDRGWGLMWRVELQRRGALHWHGIGIQPVGEPPFSIGESERAFREAWVKTAGIKAAIRWRELWFTALDRLPRVSWKWCGRVVEGPRSARPGARVHAVDAQWEGGAFTVSWLRYLQEHTSKRKQAQEGRDVGRHWGIVGRRHFVRVAPDSRADLSGRELSLYLRALQRMSRPRRPGECPFGCKLGWRSRRGRRGSSVWFVDTEVSRRLVEWAKAEAAAPVGDPPKPASGGPLPEPRGEAVDGEGWDDGGFRIRSNLGGAGLPARAAPPASQGTASTDAACGPGRAPNPAEGER